MRTFEFRVYTLRILNVAAIALLNWAESVHHRSVDSFSASGSS